jgi:hypothetical protein
MSRTGLANQAGWEQHKRALQDVGYTGLGNFTPDVLVGLKKDYDDLMKQQKTYMDLRLRSELETETNKTREQNKTDEAIRLEGVKQQGTMEKEREATRRAEIIANTRSTTTLEAARIRAQATAEKSAGRKISAHELTMWATTVVSTGINRFTNQEATEAEKLEAQAYLAFEMAKRTATVDQRTQATNDKLRTIAPALAPPDPNRGFTPSPITPHTGPAAPAELRGSGALTPPARPPVAQAAPPLQRALTPPPAAPAQTAPVSPGPSQLDSTQVPDIPSEGGTVQLPRHFSPEQIEAAMLPYAEQGRTVQVTPDFKMKVGPSKPGMPAPASPSRTDPRSTVAPTPPSPIGEPPQARLENFPRGKGNPGPPADMRYIETIRKLDKLYADEKKMPKKEFDDKFRILADEKDKLKEEILKSLNIRYKIKDNGAFAIHPEDIEKAKTIFDRLELDKKTL